MALKEKVEAVKEKVEAKVEEVKQEVEAKAEAAKEMTTEEAKKWRASLAKTVSEVALSENQLREKWRLYWAQNKAKWANSDNMEQFIWLHMKAVKMNVVSKFEEGIKHFGLKKIS